MTSEFTFNFRYGTPIARIDGGGILDERVIHVAEGKADPEEKRRQELLALAVELKYDPTDFKKRLYEGKTAEQELLMRRTRKLRATGGGVIQPTPANDCTRVFVFGPTGCGKSTYTSRYVDEYKRLWPNNKIYLFTPVRVQQAASKPKQATAEKQHSDYPEDEEEAPEDEEEHADEKKKKKTDGPYVPFEDSEPIRVRVDDTIGTLKVENFENTCCIFDDIDFVNLGDDTKTEKACAMACKLRDTMLARGGHLHITVITTSHVFAGRKKTTYCHLECDTFVSFPQTPSTQLYTWMKDNEIISGVKQKRWLKSELSGSRWCALQKKFPGPYFMTESMCFFPESFA